MSLKYSLRFYALLFVCQVSCESWNAWPESDVTVTNTVTSIQYVCPCSQATLKISGTIPAWGTWSGGLALETATTTTGGHNGFASWEPWHPAVSAQATTTDVAFWAQGSSQNTVLASTGTTLWRQWANGDSGSTTSITSPLSTPSSSLTTASISPILTSSLSPAGYFPNTTSSSADFVSSVTTDSAALTVTTTANSTSNIVSITTTTSGISVNPTLISTTATNTDNNVNPTLLTTTSATSTSETSASSSLSSSTTTTSNSVSPTSFSIIATTDITVSTTSMGTTTTTTDLNVSPTLLSTTSVTITTVSETTLTPTTTTTTPPAQTSIVDTLVWTPFGCYTDSVEARTLSIRLDVPGGYTNMTVEGCEQTCLTNNYPIAGLEYAQECWCGNGFENGGAPAPDGDTGCDQPCTGNASEICGGPNRLNIYIATLESG